MSQYKTIKRYALLIEMIEKLEPDFETIKDIYEVHGHNKSPRTIQRDIQYIRHHFGIDIEYSTELSRYRLNKEDSPNLPNFMRFIELANTAAIIVDGLQDGREAISYMDFESDGSLRGYDLLEPLLHAIRNHRLIQFSYEKYKTSELNEYCLQPLLLKEFQNRWYLVGLRNDIGQLRVFGIDRISRLETLNKTFRPRRNFRPLDMFRHTIGINSTENEPEFVELSFTELQGKYAKALPWHHSQETLVDNEDEFRIRLYVNPNLELVQRILATGSAVKVLSPGWLVDKVRNELKKSLDQYE